MTTTPFTAPPVTQTHSNGQDTPRPRHHHATAGLAVNQRPSDDPADTENDGQQPAKATRPEPAPDPPTEHGWDAHGASIKRILAASFLGLLLILTMFTGLTFGWMMAIASGATVAWLIIAYVARLQRIDQKTERFITQAVLRKRKVGTFNTNGGAGKSTVIGCLATMWGYLSRAVCGILDFNYNSGHVLERLGIPEYETLRVEEVLEVVDEDGVLHTMIQGLPTTEFYLYGIDRAEKRRRDDKLNWDRAHKAIASLFFEFHSLFIDNANDVTGDSELAAAHSVDVVILTAYTGKRETLGDVSETLETMERNGMTNLRQRCLVVLCRPYPWPFSRLNRIPNLPADIPTLYLPADFHLWRVRKGGKRLRFSKLRAKTREALLDIALKVCELSPTEGEMLRKDGNREAWKQAKRTEAAANLAAIASPPVYPAGVEATPGTPPEEAPAPADTPADEQTTETSDREPGSDQLAEQPQDLNDTDGAPASSVVPSWDPPQPPAGINRATTSTHPTEGAQP